MIFKTFDSDIDNMSSRWGMFEKSFSDIRDTITTKVDKIDEELKLLNEAKTELSERSRPQYSFSCNLDNLFNLPEFKSWHSEVKVGNFSRLETTESHQEKLRITSISFNPCADFSMYQMLFDAHLYYE